MPRKEKQQEGGLFNTLLPKIEKPNLKRAFTQLTWKDKMRTAANKKAEANKKAKKSIIVAVSG